MKIKKISGRHAFRIGIEVTILAILLFVSCASALSNSGGGNWQHYKNITLDNSGSTLTDYQVLVNLTGSNFPVNAQVSGADVRFTNLTGKEMKYWIEKWDPANSSALVWVNVTNIPSGTSTIRMFYGNTLATSSSNGAATFEFFDDFEGSYDSSWTLGGTAGTNPSASTDRKYTGIYSLKSPSGSPTGGKYLTKSDKNFGTNISVDVEFYDPNSDTNTSNMFFADDGIAAAGEGVGSVAGITTVYAKRIGSTFSATSVARTTGWHKLSFHSSSSGTEIFIDNTSVGSNATPMNMSRLLLGSPWAGPILVTNYYYDTVIVRKHVPTDIANTVGAEQNKPTVVYVDVAYSDGNAGGHFYGYDAFNTIQGGVNAVAIDGMITVNPGTYTEPSVGTQMVISKNLSIIGVDEATTIIKPSADTGTTDDLRGWFLINSGVNFNMTGVTLDGTGKKINIAIFSHGPGTIRNSTIKNMVYNPSTDYAGRCIATYDANMVIDGVTLSNIGRIGIYVGSNVTNAVISNNMYTGKGVGNWLDYGIEVESGGIATIIGNTVSNCTGVANDGSTSAGILATTYFNPGTTATIIGNDIKDNTIGIAVGYDAADTTTVIAHYNNFTGNEEGVNSTNATVNATLNWWGSASGPGPVGPGTGDNVSTNVLYNPWLGQTPTLIKYYMPFLYQRADLIYDAGVHVQNDGTTSANVTIQFYYLNGTSAGSGTYTVLPGELMTKHAFDITGTMPAFVGPAVVTSNVSVQVQGYINTVNEGVYSIAPSLTVPATSSYIPFLYQRADNIYDAGVQVFNPGPGTATVTINMYYLNGTLAGSNTSTVGPNAEISKYAFDITGTMPAFVGPVEITSDEPVVAQGFIRTRASLIYSIAPSVITPVLEAYLPFLYQRADNIYDAGVQVYNPGPGTATVTINMYYLNGTLAGSNTSTVGPKAEVSKYAFDIAGTMPAYVGSAEITSSGQAVVAQGFIRTRASLVYSIAPQVRKPVSIEKAHLPFLYQTVSATHDAGIQVMNPGSGVAEVNITLYYPDGTFAGRNTSIVSPKAEVSKYVFDIAPTSVDFSGSVVVEANQSVVSQGFIRKRSSLIYSIAPPVER